MKDELEANQSERREHPSKQKPCGNCPWPFVTCLREVGLYPQSKCFKRAGEYVLKNLTMVVL